MTLRTHGLILLCNIVHVYSILLQKQFYFLLENAVIRKTIIDGTN